MLYELEGGMVWYGITMEQEGRTVIWNRREAVISRGGRHCVVWSRKNRFCMEQEEWMMLCGTGGRYCAT